MCRSLSPRARAPLRRTRTATAGGPARDGRLTVPNSKPVS